MIIFGELIMVIYIWVHDTTIKDIIILFSQKQHFATTIRRFTQKIMILVY